MLWILACEPSTSPPSVDSGESSALVDSVLEDSAPSEPDWEDLQLRYAEATLYGSFYGGLSSDRDGDGVADLVTVSPQGRLQGWLGPLEGELEREPDAETAVEWATPLGLASTLTVLGDVDGDGLEDLAVGAPLDGSKARGAVRIVRGDGSPVGSEAALLVGLRDYHYLGFAVRPAGDQDDDGLVDLLVAGLDEETAFVVPGSFEGTASVGDAARLVVLAEGWSVIDAASADLDADGLEELVFAGTQGVYGFAHGLEGQLGLDDAERSWPAEPGSWVVQPSDGGLWAGGYQAQSLSWLDSSFEELGRIEGEAGFGYRVEPVGDLDGDGVAELGVEQIEQGGANARWFVLRDEPLAGVHAVEDLAVELELSEGGYVGGWHAAGDVDADGLDEVWVFGLGLSHPEGARRLGL